MINEIIAEKLALLPNSPGVYIMKDAEGTIIYVGKAVVLKNRVSQYFQNNKSHSAKVKAMLLAYPGRVLMTTMLPEKLME